MDRAIDPAFASAQKRRRLGMATAVIAFVAFAFSYGPTLLKPSVPRSRLRIEKVDRGPVEASIAANGTVTPELEEVIASPVDARVTRILKRAGDAIKAGQPILELDLSEPALAFERVDRDVSLKRNEQQRSRLDLRRTLADLDAATEAKRLEVESLRARLAQQTELAASGLVSKDGLREAQLNEARAALELKRLIASREITEEMNQAQVDGMNLELATLEGQRREARRVLDLGSTRAVRDSVLTWTVTEAGALIRRGEPLARLSDLKSFRIEATVLAVHGRSLRPGLEALVRIGAVDLRGEVSTVEPTVRDGVMRLWIRLEDATNTVLRPSLKADVQIVTDRRAHAIRVARGPFLMGEASQEVFVVRDGSAFRTRVDLGLIGYDVVEIARGLESGDEMIVSGRFTDRGHDRRFLLLEEMTEEVRAAEKDAYEKLIRMVAHEVGNSVAASSSLLQSSLSYSRHIPGADRADFEDAVGVCLARLSTLNGFVRDLAEVVRLPEPRLQPCDLASLLRGTSLLLRASALKVGVSWTLELDEPLPMVLADRAQIEQAFLNIAKNAIEAAGPRGWVLVRARRDGGEVAVVIENGSQGIPGDVQSRLFTPFFSTKADGRGLGLILVREILVHHKAPFSLSGPPGGPTRFVFSLPQVAEGQPL